MAVFAIDAGGTRIKLGLVEDGEVVVRATIDARSDQGLAPQLPRIATALHAMPLGGRRVTGVGMAFPSLVDTDSGRVTRDSGKYRDARDLDLNAWCRDAFGVPFAIENDARMAAIGEWRHGAGRGTDDLVMMTLGTGIGTSAIMGGGVVRGKHGQAGCLGGHFVVDPNGHRCPCGATGCVEAEASTQTLPARAAERPEFMASALRNARPLDYAAVFRLAGEGDALATSLRDEALGHWGALAVSLIHAYDPEVLILGGGILASGETILPAIRESVRRNAWRPWGDVRVVPSELGDDAALLACEWLVGSRASQTYETTLA